MELFDAILNKIDDIVWGLPTIILILATGLILTIRTKGMQFTKLGRALKSIFRDIEELLPVLQLQSRQHLRQAFSALYRLHGCLPCPKQDVYILSYIGNLQVRQAVLHGAKELPGPPQLQVLLRQHKAIRGTLHNRHPLPGGLRPFLCTLHS